MIPEIDIWRAATLMLKRYGDKALEESAARADELAAQNDYHGQATWRRPLCCTDDIKSLSTGGSFRVDPPSPTAGFILDNIMGFSSVRELQNAILDFCDTVTN